MAFYNAEPETEEDVTAKSIALDKLMSKLKKRRSPYLERSGVFLLGYPKENVKEWSNSKLEEMYKAVGAETVVYKKRKTAYVDEKDALNKIRMTAREEVIKEKIRRDNFRNMLGVSCDLVIFLLRFAIPI